MALTANRVRLREIGHLASPRYWRWRRFLRGLNLDPDRFQRPVPEPGPGDFIICGPSRSGTSLACAALHQPPTSVTVMEPWDGMRLAPAELFASLRREIDDTRALRRGRLRLDALQRDGSVRWQRDGEITHPVTVGDGYLLGVKWPAFWRYLDLLPSTRFVVCLRHPADMIASFRTTGGRLAEGLDYDIAFNRSMNRALRAATPNPTLRRILLHEYVMARILPHLSRANVYALRYERWFSEPAEMLDELGRFLDADLSAPRVAIRPSPGEPDLSSEEWALLKEHCSSAEATGYTL